MDKLFNAPSGPISHREVRAAVAEEISVVMYNPVVDAFRSLRQMSANEIAHFNPLRPSPPGGSVVDPSGFDYSSDDSLLDREKLRLNASMKYYSTIGDYESSSFYCEFLSDEVILAPSGRMVSVRDITEELSRSPTSSFRSWFRMPLFKVTDIVSRFLAEGWIDLSHHCRSIDRLQIKADLLVLGFQTDATRITSLKLNNDHSSLRFPNLGVDYMIHHLLSHQESDDWLKVNRFFMEQLAWIADKLDAVQEGERTALDNSVIMYCSSMLTGTAPVGLCEGSMT